MFAYILLGVNSECSDEVIKAAYMERSRRYSPDRHPEYFKKIRSAYEKIRTHDDRVKYEIFHKDDLSRDDIFGVVFSSKQEINLEPQIFTNYFKEYIK